MSKSEKIVVFDENSYPKELKYYENERLVARLGVIRDGEGKFIGLRELEAEAVAPQSWIDRLKGVKPQPRRIDISTIDFIGLINWIDTIRTINTIKTIENIETITNGNLNLLSKVTQVDRLNPSGTEEKITNGGFETTPPDFSGWQNGASSLVNTEQHSGTYSCNMGVYGQFIKQTYTENIGVDSIEAFSLWIKREAGAGTERITFTVSGVDYEAALSCAADGDWHEIDLLTLLTGLVDTGDLEAIKIWKANDGNTEYYIDDVSLTGKYNAVIDIVKAIESMPSITGTVSISGNVTVQQSTRTSLKTQPERTDLLFKRFSNTFGAAADYEVLAAVADQSHKVYAYGCRVSAAVESEFRDGTSSTKQFGVDNIAGLRMQTLLHPFIATANTALNFRAEAACSVLGWIEYITEA